LFFWLFFPFWNNRLLNDNKTTVCSADSSADRL
jgi:hypothetical protein